jgi:hypothetical protein
MTKVMSSFTNDRGTVRLSYDEIEGYLITWIPEGALSPDNEVLIYSTEVKEEAGIKFYQLGNGVIRTNGWLDKGEY